MVPRVHRAAASLALLGLLMTRGAAGAEPSPAEVDGVDERYAAITGALDRGEASARLWWWGWTGIFTGILVGEGSVALATHDRTRADAVVGTVGAALGLGSMFLASRSAFTFRARLARMDSSRRACSTPTSSVCDSTSPEARLARLREAERILDEAANDEEQGRAWYTHVGGDVVTLVGSFVLWKAYHEYWDGWLNLVGGVIVNEAQILTRPRAAIRARRAYRDGTLTVPPPGSSVPGGFTISVVPGVGGLSLVGKF
jgi:hypothetical protein